MILEVCKMYFIELTEAAVIMLIIAGIGFAIIMCRCTRSTDDDLETAANNNFVQHELRRQKQKW